MSDYALHGYVMGFEKLTVGTAVATMTAGSLAPSGTPPPTGALITVVCVNEGINFRCDGGNPGSPAGSGHYVAGSSSAFIDGINSLKQFKAVRTGTADASVAVSYVNKF